MLGLAGQWINAQTFAENKNIKDNLTEMPISAFYLAKAASVVCVFWFYFYLDSNEKVWAAEVIAKYKQSFWSNIQFLL